jgi:hypothetical protein
MRLRPDVFLFVTAGIILALHARSPLFAQTKGVAANLQGAAVSVPFIGCASSGQTEMLEAPKGPSRSVPISPEDAQALAYYTSADGIGLLAPRGWYCEGVSGSSGYALFLSPKPIQHSMSGWEGLEGSAIEINHMNGGTSGRFDIAQIIGRVFPAYRAFAIRALEGFDLPISSGPYPKDTLEYRGKTIVEFKTPAQTEGLGNFDSWLGKSDMPIVGAAILVVDPPNRIGNPPDPDMVRLSVRLPPDLVRLTPAIVSYVERDVVGAARK